MSEEVVEMPPQPYSLTQIPFTYKTGKPYHLDYAICASTIGEAMVEEAVKSRIDAIRLISDIVYPPTKVGGPMHEDHEKYVASWSQFAAIIDDETQEVIGFHFIELGKLEGTDFTAWDMHAGGVDPRYQGRGIFERSSESLIEKIKPAVIFGSTIHPSIYFAYKRMANGNDFIFFPEDANTPAWMLAFSRKVITQFSSEASAASLDDLMVKRHHLPMAVQGEIPYHDFTFFEETLHVNPDDGVFVIMLKSDVLKWAEKEFTSPRERTPEN